MAPLSPLSKTRAQLTVTQSATILKRFYFLERELILLLAGWLPGTTQWEAKLIYPELLWEASLRARDFRQRVLELRFPERRIAVDADAPLLDVFRRCGDAPHSLGFTLALGDVLLPYVLALYRKYQSLIDPLDDGPTQRLLRHGIGDLEMQISRLDAVAQQGLRAFPADSELALAWRDAVAAEFHRLPLESFLTASSAILTPGDALVALARPFAIRRQGARDPRFHIVSFAWPDRHTPGNPGHGVQLQARQAVHHVNEVWAAEMAAACIHDLGPDAPHEFLDEAARWCYDEIRHCRMGYERLREWGFSDSDIPLDSFSYNAGAHLDALTRLGIIFYFEATYIHTKKERTDIFAEMGDRLSSHDMDFDWADELIHTHYGKRWLEYFLKDAASPKRLNDIKEDARAAVALALAHATASDRAAASAAFDHIMKRMPSLAAETA